MKHILYIYTNYSAPPFMTLQVTSFSEWGDTWVAYDSQHQMITSFRKSEATIKPIERTPDYAIYF